MNIERMKQPFGSAVIEPGSEWVKLLYNRSADCVIAQFLRVSEQQIPASDLYFRKASDADYVRVRSDPGRSYDDPVSCGRKPYVFFNMVQWGEASTGGDWVCLARLSLPHGAVTPLVDRTKLKLPDGCARGWIASILDVDDQGTVATCRLAFEVSTGLERSRVEYSIRDLDLATGEHDLLVNLPGIFV